MKKKFIFLATLFTFLLTGCGANNSRPGINQNGEDYQSTDEDFAYNLEYYQYKINYNLYFDNAHYREEITIPDGYEYIKNEGSSNSMEDSNLIILKNISTNKFGIFSMLTGMFVIKDEVSSIQEKNNIKNYTRLGNGFSFAHSYLCDNVSYILDDYGNIFYEGELITSVILEESIDFYYPNSSKMIFFFEANENNQKIQLISSGTYKDSIYTKKDISQKGFTNYVDYNFLGLEDIYGLYFRNENQNEFKLYKDNQEVFNVQGDTSLHYFHGCNHSVGTKLLITDPNNSYSFIKSFDLETLEETELTSNEYVLRQQLFDKDGYPSNYLALKTSEANEDLKAEDKINYYVLDDDFNEIKTLNLTYGSNYMTKIEKLTNKLFLFNNTCVVNEKMEFVRAIETNDSMDMQEAPLRPINPKLGIVRYKENYYNSDGKKLSIQGDLKTFVKSRHSSSICLTTGFRYEIYENFNPNREKFSKKTVFKDIETVQQNTNAQSYFSNFGFQCFKSNGKTIILNDTFEIFDASDFDFEHDFHVTHNASGTICFYVMKNGKLTTLIFN